MMMWMLKWYFIIIILLAMLAFNMLMVHFVCYVGNFRYWDYGRDQNDNDFLFLGTNIGALKS